MVIWHQTYGKWPTTQIVREETHCCYMVYSFQLTAWVLLYASSHRQDNTYHSLCYTSCGALAGTRNMCMRLWVCVCGGGWVGDRQFVGSVPLVGPTVFFLSHPAMVWLWVCVCVGGGGGDRQFVGSVPFVGPTVFLLSPPAMDHLPHTCASCISLFHDLHIQQFHIDNTLVCIILVALAVCWY